MTIRRRLVLRALLVLVIVGAAVAFARVTDAKRLGKADEPMELDGVVVSVDGSSFVVELGPPASESLAGERIVLQVPDDLPIGKTSYTSPIPPPQPGDEIHAEAERRGSVFIAREVSLAQGS